MTTYRERLTAPPSWWLSALAFAVVWGWIMLVVTTWPIAIATVVIVAIPCFVVVWRYGSLLITADSSGLRVGGATLDRTYLGEVAPLGRVDYRHKLGVGANARAYLVTRPYLDRGVMVDVTDSNDPAPYWLVSSRHPDALAAALGHTGKAPPPAQGAIGEATRGEEA